MIPSSNSVNLFNLDYEFKLFNSPYDGLKERNKILTISKEFEYVYFLIEKEQTTLKNLKNYSDDYLSYLKDLGFTIPQFIKKFSGNLNNWWGELKDRDAERILNSKETSTKFALDKGFCHSGTKIIHSKKEFLEHLQNYNCGQWIARSSFSSGGNGIFKFKKDHLFNDKISNILLKGPIILEPNLNRILDFGVTLSLGDKSPYFFTRNFVSKMGNFKGGIVYNENKILERIFFSKQKWMDSYFIFLDEVKRYYKKIGASDALQIDSFFYEERNEIKCYPLVEVNYRKTMGLVLKNMQRFLPHNGIGGWYIFSKKDFLFLKSFDEQLKKIGSFIYDKKTKCGILPTSPVNYNFPSLFISAKNENELNKNLEFIKKTLLNKNSNLPKEFIS